jgi:thiosulfate/3-mercaptopyruvate sulfurtransferase
MSGSSPSFGPLVSPGELAAALEGEAPPVVIDASWTLRYEGPKSPAADYATGHLPGARFFDFRRVTDPDSPLHDTVCSPEAFQAYARELGITDEHLVFYSQGRFSGAARALWLFRKFGHERVSVLDGGLSVWKAQGRPLTSAVPEVEPGAFEARPNPALLRNVVQVERALEDGVQLVDARPPAIHAGEKDFFDAYDLDSPARGKPGRIEGSKNLPSTAVIRDDGRFLPLDELRHVVEAAGIDPAAPTVASCSLGVGASAAAFALSLLGNRDVAVFDGSWEAWAIRD